MYGGICCIAGKQISEFDIGQRIRQQTKSNASMSGITSLFSPDQISSHQTPPQHLMVRPREEAKQSTGNETILSGTEARRRRADPIEESKYWSICLLEIFFKKLGSGNQKFYATGVFISESHVLTAAHNLFDRSMRQWPDYA